MNSPTTTSSQGLPQSFHPKAIMSRPDTIQRLCDTYYRNHTTQNEANPDQPTKPMTPASLALHLGFASVPQMLSAADSPEHPLESQHYLVSAMTAIEAQMSEDGLKERSSVAMCRFLLSARLGVIEKKEIIDPEANKLTISIKGVTNNTQVNATTGVKTNLQELL